MRLPRLEQPERYAGLFVVDFGETCSVGYTAEEVAWLIESEAHAAATVYRIHHAEPDGTLALRGVPRDRFSLESGLCFHSRDAETARADFDALKALADAEGLPCRAELTLARHGRPGQDVETHGRDARATGDAPDAVRLPFVVALAYPAECEEEIARWMIDHEIDAGEYADGGIGRLQQMRELMTVIDSAQLAARPSRQARTRDEVLAAVGDPIQRTA